MDMGLWGTILQWAGGLVLLAGAMGVLVKGGRWVARIWTKIERFLDDWNGEEARPGRDAVPSVMERLVRLEKLQERVVHEVTPNSGSSMKDALGRVEAGMARQDAIPADPTYVAPSGNAI